MPGFAEGTVDDTLPPPAQPGATPTTAPELPPGEGGPGSYPAAGPPPPETDYYGFTNSGVPMQLINDLGFNPSYSGPYGGSGSGMPTQKFFGFLGNLLGGVGGNFIAPGGGLVGSKLGGIGARMLTRYAQKPGMQLPGQGGSSGGGGSQGPQGGYFDPAYLKSIGYGPGQGTGSLWPGNTGDRGYAQDNPNSPLYDPNGPFAGSMTSGGIAGGGGSFFHGNIPGGTASPQPGAFAGLGSFSGGGPIGGETWGNSWGNINSPLGRAALSGVGFDPAKMPSPGFQIPGATGPGNMPIINWAAFGQGVSPGQSAHFQPRSTA